MERKQKLLNIFNNDLLRTSFALTSGRIVNMVVSFILLLIQSRFIGPEITGRVASFAIPLGYLWILTLGVPSALARELPYYIAKNKKDKALLYAQTAQSFSIVMGLICGLAFGLLSIISLVQGNYFNAMGWGFQVAAAFFAIYNSYITTLYRTTDEFKKIANSNFITAMASLIVFPFIYLNAYFGLFLRPFATQISSNIYLFFKRPFKLKFGFNKELFRELFTFGMPIIVVGYIEANLWSSTQSTIILKFGGNYQLGLFNFVNQILLLLLIIPNVVSEMLRPRFAAEYGKTNKNIKKTLNIAFKPLMIALFFSIIAIVGSWLIMEPLISWLLPKYVEAIPALEIALLLIPIMTLKTIKYMFVVTKKILLNIASTVPGFIIALSLLYYLMYNNYNFKYIFLPYIIGQLTNFIISVIILCVQIKLEGDNSEFSDD